MISLALLEIAMRLMVLTMAATMLMTACADKDDAGHPDYYVYGHGSADPAPDVDVGTWSGAGGTAFMSLVLADDGSGLLCTSADGTKDVVRRVKYRAGLLLTEDDAKISITDADHTTMKLQAIDAAGAIGDPYQLQRDQDLKLASPACGKHLLKLR
jgi:hypothetical protein